MIVACIGCELWAALATMASGGLLVFLKVYGKRIRHFLESQKSACGCPRCGPYKEKDQDHQSALRRYDNLREARSAWWRSP